MTAHFLLKNAIRLTHRSLVRVKGPDAVHLLQRMLTKDLLTPPCRQSNSLSYAILVGSHRGRVIHDFFVYNLSERESHRNGENEEAAFGEKGGDHFLLEATSRSMSDTLQLLIIHRLRDRVEVGRVEHRELSVYFTPDLPPLRTADGSSSGTCEGGLRYFPDPRVPGFGYRVLAPPDAVEIQGEGLSQREYLKRRMQFGIPEGFKETGGQFPFFMNGDIMNGIDIDKKGYLGDQLVRDFGHIGRRVVPFTIRSEQCYHPSSIRTFSPLVDRLGRDAGKVIKYRHGDRTSQSSGMALIRMEALNKQDELGPIGVWEVGKQRVVAEIEAYRPDWWPAVVPVSSYPEKKAEE